jgi:PAS domain S-box-containing protein
MTPSKPAARSNNNALLFSAPVLRWVLGTLAISLILSGAAIWHQINSNLDAAQRDMERVVYRVTDTVISRIELFQYGLRGVRGAVISAGPERLSRDLFHQYALSRDIEKEFPGAHGFGFVRRVPRAEEHKFLAAARADGAPNFTIHEMNPHGGERYIIQYIEPLTVNAAALGLDLASEPERRKAAETALLTGEATLTGPITLVQAAKQQAFGLLMPIYNQSPAPQSVAARSAAGIGWAFAPLVVAEVLEPLDLDETIYRLRLIDVTNPSVPLPFYDTHPDAKPALVSAQIERAVFGRRWQIEMSALPPFFLNFDHTRPYTVLLICIVTTLLATALAAALSIIVQRKKIAQAEQARLATIVENSSDAIIGEALDGTITSWNRAAERLLGYPAALAIGQNLATLLVPHDRMNEDARVLREIAAGETVTSFDSVRLHRDGTPIDVAITAGPVREADGRISGAAKLLRDIRLRVTEERRLREFSAKLEREVQLRTNELTRTNTLLKEVMNAASEVAVIATDCDGIVRIFNNGAERMLGYRADELLNKRISPALHLPEELKARAEALSKEYGVPISGLEIFMYKPRREGSDTVRWTYVRKDGSHVQVNLVITPMRDDAGNITGFLGIAKDITEDLRAAEALQEAKLAAEAANIAKSRFLATMSHEIRTPINGILGMAQMLLQPGTTPDAHTKYAHIILESGQTLLQLLNDILDFSKIEAGKVELEMAAFSPERIAADVEHLFAVAMQQKGLEFRVQWHGPPGAQYIGDPFRIRQMLTNLVSNAVKFTSAGSVTVDFSATLRGSSLAILEFAVTDTGIGISPEARDALFRPFSQAESSTTRKFGGTGLGLSIVRNLAVMMGGEAGVSSGAMDRGSRFWFRVPVKVAQRGVAEFTSAPLQRAQEQIVATTNAPSAYMPLKGRVLVVEDVMTNRLVIEAMMSKFNLVPRMAENGQQACDIITQGEVFDVIVMDVQMPIMDGYDATRTIRAYETANHRPRTPIVALTAAAYDEDRRAASDAGMDDYLTKPLDIGRLYAMLHRWLKDKAA